MMDKISRYLSASYSCSCRYCTEGGAAAATTAVDARMINEKDGDVEKNPSQITKASFRSMCLRFTFLVEAALNNEALSTFKSDGTYLWLH